MISAAPCARSLSSCPLLEGLGRLQLDVNEVESRGCRFCQHLHFRCDGSLELAASCYPSTGGNRRDFAAVAQKLLDFGKGGQRRGKVVEAELEKCVLAHRFTCLLHHFGWSGSDDGNADFSYPRANEMGGKRRHHALLAGGRFMHIFVSGFHGRQLRHLTGCVDRMQPLFHESF